MTAPVLPALPATRAVPSRGADRSPGDGAAFASALDGALTAGRETGRPETGRPAGERRVGRDAAGRHDEPRAEEPAEGPQDTSVGRRDGAPGRARTEDDAAPPTDDPAAADATAVDPSAAAQPVPPTAAWALLVQGVLGQTAAAPAATGIAATIPGIAVPPGVAATSAVPGAGATAGPAGGPVPGAGQFALPPASAGAPADVPPPVLPAAVPAPGSPAAAPTLPADAAAVLDGIPVVLAQSPAGPATPAAGAAALPAVPDADPTAPAVADAGAGAPPVAEAEPAAATTTGGGDSSPADGDGTTPAMQSVAAAAPAAATTGPAAPSAPAAAAPQTPVNAQLAQPVAVLASRPDGVHTMTVVLTPDDLGPVQVQVTVSKGTVDLTLRGASEHGRAALLEALPALRADLQSAGVTCSRLDVSRDGGAWTTQQQAPGQQWQQGGQQQGFARGDGRPAPWARSTDPGEGRPASAPSSSSASTGVDVLA